MYACSDLLWALRRIVSSAIKCASLLVYVLNLFNRVFPESVALLQTFQCLIYVLILLMCVYCTHFLSSCWYFWEIIEIWVNVEMIWVLKTPLNIASVVCTSDIPNMDLDVLMKKTMMKILLKVEEEQRSAHNIRNTVWYIHDNNII